MPHISSQTRISPARVNIPAVLSLVLALDGFLNLATGLAGIFGLKNYIGAMSGYLGLSPVKTTSAMLSVLLGVLLIILGKGLYERRRASWVGAVAVITLLMANNIYRGTSVFTLLFSGVILVAMLVFRKQFRLRTSHTLGYGQVIALFSVVFALGYGIIGSYLLRDDLSSITTWTDCVYFTVVTYSTVGYGDVTPVSPTAKMFIITMIPLGLTSFLTAVSALIGPAIEKRMKGVLNLMQKMQHVSNHVIICGYSSVAESIINELQKRGTQCILIEDRQPLLESLLGKGRDVVQGDPTRRETLEAANVQHAAAIISAYDSDAVNILVTVTARKLRDTLKGAGFRIVVRVEDEENIEKAQQVGADEVISPSSIGGRMMAELALAQ